MDATVTSENFFRRPIVDAIAFNCEPLTMDASLVLEDFFGSSRIPPMV